MKVVAQAFRGKARLSAAAAIGGEQASWNYNWEQRPPRLRSGGRVAIRRACELENAIWRSCDQAIRCEQSHNDKQAGGGRSDEQMLCLELCGKHDKRDRYRHQAVDPRQTAAEFYKSIEIDWQHEEEEGEGIGIDFKGSSSKKKTRAPIRCTLAEEMSIEKQIKRSSPNVIARLMGLDTLPSPEFLKSQKEVSSCSQKVSSKELQKLTGHGNCLLQTRNDEHEECKDVFEVKEEPKVENHKNQGSHKEIENLKKSEMDMAFIRQSFINAKRLSTDEKLQRSKEFDDALEVLESNKDLFLKLLQEPHSLFSKHLQNHDHSPPPPHASYTSPRDCPMASHESPSRSEIKVGRYPKLKSSDLQPMRKHTAKSKGHPFREPMCSLPDKSSDPIEDSSPPTQIVILKPGLAYALKVERTARSVKYVEDSKYDVINYGKFSKEEIMDLYQEERDQQKFQMLENMRLRTKHTAELAKNVTQQMRNSSATGRKTLVPKYGMYAQNDDPRPMPRVKDAKNSLSSYWTNDNVHDYGKCRIPLPSCAFQSTVDLEARKHLSEQRRLSHHLQGIGLSLRASNTLSEMLALSDKEISKTSRNTSVVKKACPLGISSKDGWKDGFSRNLARSKSLPASSLEYRNLQHNSRSGIVGCKSRHMPKNIHNFGSGAVLDNDQINPKCSLKNLGDHPSRSKLHSDVEGNKLPILEIHASSDRGRDALLPPHFSKSVAISPTSYKEADQPSPVSVLDLSPTDEKSTSGCFKRIGEDLQELRRQLQLLKFDTENNFPEEIKAFISGDEDAAEPFSQFGDIHQSFRDEEDRDYSYLLDILIDSGIMKSEKSGVFGACHLEEFPVGVDAFDRLEKKYKSVMSWSMSERKLLFDLVNSTVADIAVMPFMNIMRTWVNPRLSWQSKMSHEGIVEEIWQAVVKRRKEAGSCYSEEELISLKWFNFGSGESEVVGRELENLLSENLMDELVEELLYIG
ncbi:hypothetical protein KSP40_PGU016967 [Platanthera guangdongensis]|uniref:DUF4378 domain-containing protein n=1 Tax=Platanthera guangdongensis TaxID=2320717 RepID=A0ABR2LWN3_9ASPA